MRNHLGAPIRFLTLLGALAVSASAGVQDVRHERRGRRRAECHDQPCVLELGSG